MATGNGYGFNMYDYEQFSFPSLKKNVPLAFRNELKVMGLKSQGSASKLS